MDTTVHIDAGLPKGEAYESLLPQIGALIEGEDDLIANLANVAAALKMSFGYYSWVGFYLRRGEELVLGPFQGKPACVRITAGKGVCGTAVQKGETIIVPDVTEFPGHIFCDPDSKSEIVVPIVRDKKVLGVLDVDSSSIDSFDETDKKYLQQLIRILCPLFKE